MLFNILLFFLLVHISFYSIVGYGNIINRSFKNISIENFISFSYGIIILCIFGQILYYLNINNKFLGIIIILVGLLFFRFKKNKELIIKHLLINIALFSGILISKLHEDWSYHFNFIEQISNQKFLIGISNVDDIHILSSSYFAYAQKFFFFPIFEFKMVMTLTYLVFLNLSIFLIEFIINNRNKIILIFSLILSILFIKFSRLSEYGYDYLSAIYLIQILIIYYLKFNELKNENLIWVYITFFTFASTIKISSIFFLPVVIYFIYENFKKIPNSLRHSEIYFFLFLIIAFIFESILRSGCIFYFLEFTCLSNDIIAWSVDYERVNNHSNHVELWAKGFYTQNHINDPQIYLEFKNWFNVWVKVHFFNKILEFILVPLFFLILIFVFKLNDRIKNKNLTNLFLANISIIFWLLFLPQLRFGLTSIIFLFVSILALNVDFNKSINLTKKYVYIFLLALVVFYNFKNFSRIYNEFQRDDAFYFSEFPFLPKNKILISTPMTKNIKFKLENNKSLKEYKWFNIIE